jgi:hypothetical protein
MGSIFYATGGKAEASSASAHAVFCISPILRPGRQLGCLFF